MSTGPLAEIEWTHGDTGGYAWMEVVAPSLCPECGETLDPMDCVEMLDGNREPIVVCPRAACGWLDSDPELRPADDEPWEE